MIVNYQKKYPQTKSAGCVVLDCGVSYMLCYDGSTGKYRYVDLDSGAILSMEYKSIDELFQDNGDSELVEHAEITIKE